ncbi:MAG: transcription antitermination factor NusB, partial [Phycisphaerae bacterium]|nr:transcription antitermination factor NusB [Phycisphaerae bacterium]
MNKGNARFVAADVLDELQKKKNEFVTPILHRRLKDTNEKQRTTDIVLGTLRCRDTIDHIITTCGQIAIQRIADKLMNTLRIAVCELIYNPLTPDYSIINDAVENTKHLTGQKQSAFVNAILRKIQRSIKTRNIVLTAANTRNINPRDSESGCDFINELLPDAETDLASYLNLALSLPKFLIAEWISIYGEQKARD